MKIPFFGDIKPQSLQDYYRTEINFEGRNLDLDLNFENTSINEDNLRRVKTFLENLECSIEKAKEYIDKEFQTGTEVDDYLAFHLDELTDEDLEKLLKDADKKLSQSAQLLSILKIERIGFYPEDERHYAIFDFVTDREISQYLLVVKFNKNGELDLITMES